MKNQIKELSKSMNVSETDLLMLANSVVNSIKQDKADQAYLEMGENYQVKTSLAYVTHSIKKFEQFAAKMNSCPEAKSVFTQQVLSII